MSSDRNRRLRGQRRRDLGRLLMIGITAAVMVGAARAVTAQDAPAPAPAAPHAAEPPQPPAPAPTPAPAAGGSRPSVEVSADAAVDFPGDI